jgi:TolA-binding protein
MPGTGTSTTSGDGGDSSGSSASSSASSAASASASNSLLAQAQADLAKNYFRDAQRKADAILATRVTPEVRAAALLVAADAAYGMHAYQMAATRYGEFVATYPSSPEAPRAAMRLGWAQYREGDAPSARRSWTAVANRYPTDAHAPLALALAAEVTNQAGDASEARVLLDRIVMRYPTSRYAGAARLSRSILALRQQREQDAVRDLDEVVKSAGPAAVDERLKLIQVLAVPRAELALEAGSAVAASPARADADPYERFAAAVEARDAASAPYVIHGLLLAAAAEKGWSSPQAGALAVRLVDRYPTYPPAPALLARVAQQAAASDQWPTARKAYETLAARYPSVGGKSDMDFAEALYRTGAQTAARGRLEKVAVAGSADSPRALLRLAEISEAAGDRRAALKAYDTLLRDYPRLARQPESLLAHARLLDELGPAYRARSLLRAIVENNRGEAAGEAAYRLGRMLSAEGQHRDAAEWYMTATSVAPGSKWERLALLGAGDAYTTLRDGKRALAAYDKLLHDGDPSMRGEAAYRAAEILRAEQRHAEAAKLYVQSAQLSANSATEPRALVGAVSCLVAAGDRKGAESAYQRLLQAAKAGPNDLAAARTALSAEPRPAVTEPRPAAAESRPAPPRPAVVEPRPAQPRPAEPRPAIKEWREVGDSSVSATR